MRHKAKYALEYQPTQKFYTGMTDIGPAFGGKKEQAMIFDTAADAALEMCKHWAFSGCEIVPAKWLSVKRRA